MTCNSAFVQVREVGGSTWESFPFKVRPYPGIIGGGPGPQVSLEFRYPDDDFARPDGSAVVSFSNMKKDAGAPNWPGPPDPPPCGPTIPATGSDTMTISNLQDDDVAGFVVTAVGATTLAEGGTGTFTVELATQPLVDPVSVAISFLPAGSPPRRLSSLSFPFCPALL